MTAGQFAAMPLIAAPADPESTSGGGLEEIVVTATRREERLQDVPISVLAFSQDKLDQQGIKSIDDLSRISPGLSFQRNGMSSSGNYNDEGSDINIRGVDSTAGTSTTGVYIDDTPIQTRHIGFGSINAFPALFDLDHVEVLRGPQGTLFGAGAEGGVVRFIAPDPDVTKPAGYALVDAATTDGGAPSYEGGGAINVPLIDDVLAFRASVSYRRDGGWVDRVGYTVTQPRHSLASTDAHLQRRHHRNQCELLGNHHCALRSHVDVKRLSRGHAVVLLSAFADQRHGRVLGRVVGSRRKRLSKWQCGHQSQQ